MPDLERKNISIEHNVLWQRPMLNPGKDGIFSLSPEQRFPTKMELSWLAHAAGFPSLHLFRESLAQIGTNPDGSITVPEPLLPKFRQLEGKWVESHGLEYNSQTVDGAFITAESVTHVFTRGVFKNVIPIQELNEVANERSFLKLLSYEFNNQNPLVAFEASRKRYIADMALAVRRARIHGQPLINYFNNILDVHMFTNPKESDGCATPTKLTYCHFLSYHLENNRCAFVRELKPGEKIDESLLRPNMRIHTFPMREWWDYMGNRHRVLTEPRVKDEADFIIKEIRNQTSNPRTLEDDLGGKFTFETVQEAILFIQTLQSRPIPIAPIISGVNYTINESGDTVRHEYKGNAASAKNFEINKFSIVLNGELYEIQFHNVRTKIDSLYRDGSCWQDYSINRLITPKSKEWLSVTELLFPRAIYGVDLDTEARLAIKSNQEQRRNAPIVIPEELKYKSRTTRIMTPSELRKNIDDLAVQVLDKMPKYLKGQSKDFITNLYIVNAEEDSSRLSSAARLLGRRLGIQIKHVLSTTQLEKIPKNANILIFDDIYVHGRHIRQTKKDLVRLGHLSRHMRTAVIAADESVQNIKSIYFAETIDARKTRIVFPVETEQQIYSDSLVFISTRTVFYRNEQGKRMRRREILAEVLPDGRIKLPGGKRRNGESPKKCLIREIQEELYQKISPFDLGEIVKQPVVTSYEPHPQLDKPYTPYVRHFVFRVLPEKFTDDLPKGFKWVDIHLLSRHLRWSGQRELWQTLRTKKKV